MADVFDLFAKSAARPQCEHGLNGPCQVCGPPPHDRPGHAPYDCEDCGHLHIPWSVHQLPLEPMTWWVLCPTPGCGQAVEVHERRGGSCSSCGLGVMGVPDVS